ncbi:hypothetical protein TNCV_1928151 [Trichonephila clavipes]|nr:hypothetical protein TNCV_1928151 [Trichonephila clavipes]
MPCIGPDAHVASMPQPINRIDCRVVMCQSLGNHGSDIFCWRDIWSTYRPGQQLNILRTKEILYNTGSMRSCIILLKRGVSLCSRIKFSVTGPNTQEM